LPFVAESVSALTTQLAAIDAAIAAAETAQAVGSDGTSISRAQLSTLYARRDVVQRRLESAQAVAAGRSRMFSRGRIKDMGNNL
jgi:hypothetical protein